MVYNLHTHSMYSVMDGFSSLEDIVSRVKEMGQSAVSLTEHGTMSSCYPMYKECLKQGIKFIPGIELYFCNDVTVKDTNTKHICIYAKNNIGYKNLLTLTTLAHENYYYKPRIDFDLIKQYSDGLIVTTACMGGILKVYNETDDIDDLLALKDIFNDDLYIELHTNTLDGQVEFNQKSIKYAEQYNIKLIPASDSHYAKKEDAKIHKRWQIFGEEAYTVEDFYLKSEDDYLDYFSKYLGIDKDSKTWYNMVEAQNELVNKCNVEIILGGQNYPHCGVDNVLNEIMTLCTSKLDELNITDGEYFKRLGNELTVLEQANYLEYMYMLYDLCKFTDLAGIARGVGRGSVGGSLVAFLLGITKIDPMKFDLVFERFCHLERITPPDKIMSSIIEI